jgi:hypothetical protein
MIGQTEEMLREVLFFVEPEERSYQPGRAEFQIFVSCKSERQARDLSFRFRNLVFREGITFQGSQMLTWGLGPCNVVVENTMITFMSYTQLRQRLRGMRQCLVFIDHSVAFMEYQYDDRT